MPIIFTAQLVAGVRRDDEAAVYVSHAPALTLYSQGSSESEAIRALENAVRLYLVTAYEAGFLDRVLKRHGFKTSDGPVATSPQQYIRFELFDRAKPTA